MRRSVTVLLLSTILGVLACGCTPLEPELEHATDGGDATTSGKHDAGAGRGGGGSATSGGTGGSRGPGGGDTGDGGSQSVPDAGGREDGGGGTGGTRGGGAGGGGGDASVEDSGAALPTGRCVGDGEMIDIEAGSFLRGDDSMDWASPAQLVSVEAFSIDETEVTVVAYADCVEEGACTEPTLAGFCNWGVTGRDCHPMNCVSWEQAVAFCEWVGKRLPTETEWELAARGPEARTFPWAGSATPSDPGHAQWNGTTGTVEVGSFPLGATPEGALDMAGNVWEWTSSTWCDGYEQTAVCDVTRHVDRGGGWETMAEMFMKSAFREADLMNGDDQFGFRCAK